jgi:hypothetical protein
MIESALDAGRAAARVYASVDEALAEWPLIDAFREGFSQEAVARDSSPLSGSPLQRRLHPKMQRQS